MKFIVYKDQKKITVDNVTIPSQLLEEELSQLQSNKEITLDDEQIYKLRITATRSLLNEEEVESKEILENIDGINWHQETVN